MMIRREKVTEVHGEVIPTIKENPIKYLGRYLMTPAVTRTTSTQKNRQMNVLGRSIDRSKSWIYQH